jgi:ABC-type sugar transport system substrate-binding protein
MIMKKMLTVVLALLVLLTGIGCNKSSGGSSASGGGDGQLTIGFSLDTVDSDFWVSIIQRVNDRSAAEGFRVIQRLCEGDANRQNQQVEDMIAQGVNAVIIGARDGASIVAAVKKCNDAKIPVIMISRAVMGTEGKPDAQVLVDNISLAGGSLEYLAEESKSTNHRYKVALLIGSLGDQNALERRDGHKAVIQKYPEYFDLVAEIPTDWKAEQAYAGLQNAMQKDSNIDLIITPSDTFFTTIQSVLEPLGKWVPRNNPNHVTVVGFDGDAIFAGFMESGHVDIGAVNNTIFMADESLKWALGMAKGEPGPSEMNRLDPGIVCTPGNWDSVKSGVWGYEALQKK